MAMAITYDFPSLLPESSPRIVDRHHSAVVVDRRIYMDGGQLYAFENGKNEFYYLAYCQDQTTVFFPSTEMEDL